MSPDSFPSPSSESVPPTSLRSRTMEKNQPFLSARATPYYGDSTSVFARAEEQTPYHTPFATMGPGVSASPTEHLPHSASTMFPTSCTPSPQVFHPCHIPRANLSNVITDTNHQVRQPSEMDDHFHSFFDFSDSRPPIPETESLRSAERYALSRPMSSFPEGKSPVDHHYSGQDVGYLNVSPSTRGPQNLVRTLDGYTMLPQPFDEVTLTNPGLVISAPHLSLPHHPTTLAQNGGRRYVSLAPRLTVGSPSTPGESFYPDFPSPCSYGYRSVSGPAYSFSGTSSGSLNVPMSTFGPSPGISVSESLRASTPMEPISPEGILSSHPTFCPTYSTPKTEQPFRPHAPVHTV